MKRIGLILTVAALVIGAGACDFNISDPNNPPQIGPNPSQPVVAAAVTGIIIAARSNAAGWNLDAGILGREAFRFDGSDPRFITELLQGPLDPGSGAFGGNFWTQHYAAIRSSNNLLNVIGTASALSAQEQNATRGFAETMQAYSFLMVLMAHTEDSIPVAVNVPVTAAPAPFVSNDSAHTFVSALLDSANAHLAAAGSAAFPFSLPSGFTGFTTPTTFQKFNRALKARVEVYRGSRGCAACYTAALTALAASFIDTSATADLNAGVFFNFSTNSGDAANPLFQNPQTGENFVHPSIRDSVETKTGGGNDNRYTAKVVSRPQVSAGVPPLSSDLGWIRYNTASSPVPIIRNEELILMRAEANNAAPNALAAANDINYIRVHSGGLAVDGTLVGGTQAHVLNAILRERKYSLLYEGHRWVDMRRTGRLAQIIIDRPSVDKVFPTLPIPQSEVLARK